VPNPANGSPKDVFARERQDHIARFVEEHGRARVADLAAQFEVSGVTIRKDLLVLESAQRLVRAHGGAIAIDRSRPELSFDIRERLQADEKSRIGAAGADLVRDGESIVMDASTTALSVARQLKARSGWSQLTIITNGLRIAFELAGQPGLMFKYSYTDKEGRALSGVAITIASSPASNPAPRNCPIVATGKSSSS